MAKTLSKIEKHSLKSLVVNINDNNELLCTGKDKDDKDFAQTVVLKGRCALFWNEATGNFITSQLFDELDSNYKLVDIILKVQE